MYRPLAGSRWRSQLIRVSITVNTRARPAVVAFGPSLADA